MKKRQLWINLFWTILGLFVSVYSFRLGLGKLLSPGPGLMPFGLGLIVFFLALYKLIRKSRSPQEGEEADKSPPPASTAKLALITAILLAYALSLETLGYLATTFAAMALLLRITGYKRWSLIILYSVIIVGTTYLLFTYLGVRFPPGVFGRLGIG